MQIDIGKTIRLNVATDKLPGDITDPNTPIGHALYIGLRNILMDSHAAATTDKFPVEAERVAAARGMAEKKLADLMAGNVRVAGTRAADPVEAEMRTLAAKAVNDLIRTANKKRKDIPAKAYRAAVNEYIKNNAAALRATAESVVAERKKVKKPAKPSADLLKSLGL